MFATITNGDSDRRAELHRALDIVLDATPTDPGPVLAEAIDAATTLSRAVDGRTLGLIAGVDAAGLWATEGYSSPTSWLVARTGATSTAIGSLRRTASDARSMPHVSAAAHAGLLPLSHLRLLTKARKPDVEDVFDRDEANLVAVAQTLHADALSRHLTRWRRQALEEMARNEPDGKPPLPDDETDRVRLTSTFQGRGILDGDLTPETYAIIRGAIDAEIDAWHRSGLLTGDTRSRHELQAAALIAIIRRGAAAGTTHNGPRPLIIGVADLDTLLDRADIAEADRMAYRADIIGGGPVAASIIARLLCDARFSLVIQDGDSEPLWIGRTKRTATHAQWRGIIARSQGRCEVPGCNMPHQYCDMHHLDQWNDDGDTNIDKLAMICHYHHTNIHDAGFTLTRGPNNHLQYRNPHGTLIEPHYKWAA